MSRTPTCRSRRRSRSRCRSHRCRRPRTWTPANRMVHEWWVSKKLSVLAMMFGGSHYSSPAAKRRDASDTSHASPSTDHANTGAHHPDPAAALRYPAAALCNSGASDARAAGNLSVPLESFLRRLSHPPVLAAARLPRRPLRCSSTRVLTMVTGGLARRLRRVRGCRLACKKGALSGGAGSRFLSHQRSRASVNSA